MIAEIANTPNLRQEAMQLAGPMAAAAWRKPTDNEINSALQRMMLIYKTEDFGEGEVGRRLERKWLEVYYGVLREFPIEAIVEGIEEYIKHAKWNRFPVPGAIREKVEPVAIRMRTAASRLKQAIELPGSRARDPAEQEKVRELMKEAGWLDADGTVNPSRIAATMKSGGVPPPVRRPTGETPHQMAERIRRSA